MHWIWRICAHWAGGTIRIMHFENIQHQEDLCIKQNCILAIKSANVESLQNSINSSNSTSETHQNIQSYLSVTECHRTIQKIQKGKKHLVNQNTGLQKRLQFYNTFCAGKFWQIEFIFFLNVIGQESPRQKMLSREARCTLFGSCQRNENFWIYPIFGGFIDIPTFMRERQKKVNLF